MTRVLSSVLVLLAVSSSAFAQAGRMPSPFDVELGGMFTHFSGAANTAADIEDAARGEKGVTVATGADSTGLGFRAGFGYTWPNLGGGFQLHPSVAFMKLGSESIDFDVREISGPDTLEVNLASELNWKALDLRLGVAREHNRIRYEGYVGVVNWYANGLSTIDIRLNGSLLGSDDED